jgi:hypothetical protein
MKNLKVFGLALAGIVAIMYLGINSLSANSGWGPFFIFIAACAGIGFTIDVFNHFRARGTR